MHRQLRVTCCQKCLIEHAAGSKAAERVREHGQAGGGHAGGNAHGVLLRDACVKGLGRERLQQLSGVDAAHQVAVNVHQLGIFRHHFEHGFYIAVAIGAAVLFMLADQSKTHCVPLPYFSFFTAARAASDAAIASSHCSLVGCEECAPDGSAKVAPLPFTVFKIRQVGLPLHAFACSSAL